MHLRKKISKSPIGATNYDENGKIIEEEVEVRMNGEPATCKKR